MRPIPRAAATLSRRAAAAGCGRLVRFRSGRPAGLAEDHRGRIRRLVGRGERRQHHRLGSDGAHCRTRPQRVGRAIARLDGGTRARVCVRRRTATARRRCASMAGHAQGFQPTAHRKHPPTILCILASSAETAQGTAATRPHCRSRYMPVSRKSAAASISKAAPWSAPRRYSNCSSWRMARGANACSWH